MDFALTFIEGILTFISPCILPMLPVYFVYLAGTGETEPGLPTTGNRLVLNAAGFILGFTLVFVLMGATVTAFGHFMTAHRDILRKVSGLVMVLFGLNFTGVLKLGFLNTEKRIRYDFGKLRFPGSVLFGTVFGFGWTPCLGPLLGSALALAGNAETIGRGILLLLVYSMGLGIPFLISAIVFDRAKAAIGLLQKYGRAIGAVSGFLLILAGILVFFDKLKYLVYW